MKAKFEIVTITSEVKYTQMTDVEAARVAFAEWRDKYIADNNLAWIGAGSFARAYVHPSRSDEVIKIGMLGVGKSGVAGNYAYLRFLEQIRTAQRNPFLPNIYKVEKILSADGTLFAFIVHMERLLDLKEHPDVKSEPLSVYSMVDSFAVHASEFVDRVYEVNKWKFSPEVRRAYKRALRILASRPDGVNLDLHIGNVMTRDDQLVILDPYAR